MTTLPPPARPASTASPTPAWPTPAMLGRDAVAAAVVCLAAISFYISTASLLFQGALAPQLPVAIGAALAGGVVLGLFGAVRGSLALASCGAEPATVPVLAAITAGVAAQAGAGAAFASAVVALALTAAAIGAAWWVMGRRGAGDLIRYIPYPVIGGFLGSVGWLMATGGLGVSMAQGFTLATAWGWLSGQADARLLVGAGLGVLIWQGTTRASHVLVLPGLIVASALAIHGGLWLAGLDLAAARQQGWLLAPFNHTWPTWPGTPAVWAAVNWAAVGAQAGLMASAVIVATIALLLSDTSLEVAWDAQADVNQDLRALGQGNLVAAALGGVAGGISISRSMLNRNAGAAGRSSGVLLALLCAAAMGWGGPVVALIPRPLLGGLLIYLGLGMLKAWLLDSRLRLSRADHATVLLMVAITAVFGFLPAVFVGVLACCLDFAFAAARQAPVRRMLTRSAWPGKVERSPAQQALLQATGQRLLIVELHGMLFFGSATQLTQQLEERLLQPDAPAQVVLDFRHVRWLDSSAAQALGRLFKLAARLHVRLALSGLPPAVDQALRAAGALAGPAAALHADIDAAVEAWDQAQLHDAESATVVGLADLDLEAPAAAHLLAHFDTLTLAAGDTLFRQGEASDALYLVRSGRLSAWVKTGAAPGIDEVMVRSILAGGAIGEMGLFRAVRRSATLRADTPAVVMRLQRQRLQQLEQQQPLQALALYRLFLRQLSGRLDQATAQAHALAR